MTEGYHYTGCGLDYVYLRNGFEVRETKHGRAVAVKDAHELHQVIARAIVSSPHRLRGQEVRFLRAQLKLSQEGLARALGRRRGAVALWESNPNKTIAPAAENALRMFYALHADGHDVAKRLVELLTEIDDLQHQIEVAREASFSDTPQGWQPTALAA